MQVSVESPSKVERRLTIVVPSQRIEQAVDAEVVKFAKTADIKGFRPGKVPPELVRKRFGQEVRNEAINSVIQETLNEAIRQEKLLPINQPRVETKLSSAENGLEYIATFEILPEIGPISFNIDKLEKLTAQVSEQDIKNTIERVREQHVKWKKVDRAAREKDKVSGKIQMYGEDGKPLTPESMPLEFVLKDEPSIFGWNLLEELKETKAGEERTFKHTLPQEAFLQGMAGKTLEFKIEVIEVAEPELPAIDAEFAKKLGIKSGDIEELHAEIRKQLELNLKRSIKSSMKQKVFEKLMENNPLDLPKSLIAREAQHLHDENCSMNQHGGQHKHNAEDQAYFEELAKQRIHLGLLVGEAISKHKLNPSSERVNEYLAEFASVYADADEYIKRVKADQRQLKEIETFVLEDMVVEKLLENVSIIEKEVSYEELIAPKQANPEK